MVGGNPDDEVNSCLYWRSILTYNGGADRDVNIRVRKATAVFQKVEKIWKSSKIETKIKLQLCNTIVPKTVLYASKTWKVTTEISKKLDIFHQRCLRQILGISYHNHTTNRGFFSMHNHGSYKTW